MKDRQPFEPKSPGPTALFLDTSGLFAHFHPETREHGQAAAFMEAVGNNEIPYRPLYTSTYVVDELATLLLVKGNHALARNALKRLLDSESVKVIRETEEEFDEARKTFEQFDDHEISLTDHMSAAQLKHRNVEHVFAYDGDFQTLGYEQIPRP